VAKSFSTSGRAAPYPLAEIRRGMMLRREDIKRKIGDVEKGKDIKKKEEGGGMLRR